LDLLDDAADDGARAFCGTFGRSVIFVRLTERVVLLSLNIIVAITEIELERVVNRRRGNSRDRA
jgi:hypothetical protein